MCSTVCALNEYFAKLAVAVAKSRMFAFTNTFVFAGKGGEQICHLSERLQLSVEHNALCVEYFRFFSMPFQQFFENLLAGGLNVTRSASPVKPTLPAN